MAAVIWQQSYTSSNPSVRVFGEYTQMDLTPYLHSLITERRTSGCSLGQVYRGKSPIPDLCQAWWDSRVSAKIPLPKGAQWQNFLKDSQNKDLLNKDALFQYISDELQKPTAGSKYPLLTTKANLVLSNNTVDLEALSPCQQEEADTRMMLHLRHAAEQGHTKIYLTDSRQ